MRLKPFGLSVSSLLLLLCCLPIFAKSKAPAHQFNQNPRVQQFINRMASKYHFSKKSLKSLFSKTHYQSHVIKKMTTPYESKPWYTYRSFFLTTNRIKSGAKFWTKNEKLLKRAEKQYGVDPAIIVATLGIESKYGKHQGEIRVIDALSTLAFYYPSRQRFFTKELREFLLLARELDINPLKIKGSYAGAVGQPQFMPSSYRYYAVDFSGNGTADLLHSNADVIASIANYYKKHGWKQNALITIRANIKGKKFKSFIQTRPKPKWSLRYLAKKGITPTQKLNKKQKVGFFDLQGERTKQYWIAFNNFYVITRYNTSRLYAMAVVQLAEQIKMLHNKNFNKNKKKHA